VRAQRRSSDQLRMWAQLKFGIHPALSVVGILLWIRISMTLYRITVSLGKRYPVLWYQMGCPKMPKFFIGIDLLILFSVVRPGLTRWVVSGEFRELGDPELTQLVQRLKGLVGILVVTAASSMLFAAFRSS
jgi:hypothetical protein